jgi:maltoporin
MPSENWTLPYRLIDVIVTVVCDFFELKRKIYTKASEHAVHENEKNVKRWAVCARSSYVFLTLT